MCCSECRPRVDVESLKSRIIYIRKLLRKLRKQIKNLYGSRVEVVLYGLEITLKRDGQGRIWAHPHLNIIYCTHEKFVWDQF